MRMIDYLGNYSEFEIVSKHFDESVTALIEEFQKPSSVEGERFDKSHEFLMLYKAAMQLHSMAAKGITCTHDRWLYT